MIGIASAHGAHVELATMPAMGAAESSPEASRGRQPAGAGDLRRPDRAGGRRSTPGPVGVVDYGRVLRPDGGYHEYLDGVQVRSADGIHTPAYAPGNAFAGNATEPVAHAFYDWLSPRLWPLIVATDRA